MSGSEATSGFRETRIYRVLFTDELTQDGLAALSEAWQMPAAGDLQIGAVPGQRVERHVHLPGGQLVETGAVALVGRLRRVAGLSPLAAVAITCHRCFGNRVRRRAAIDAVTNLLQ